MSDRTRHFTRSRRGALCAAAVVMFGGLAILAASGAAAASTSASGYVTDVVRARPVVAPSPVNDAVDPIASISPIAPISSATASAEPNARPAVVAPAGPTGPAGVTGPQSTVTVSINGVNGKPSQSIVIILMMTLISVAPAALMLTTSFTKIIVVLSLTRNALGLQSVPPNQVLVGLALFLSLFIMGPTFAAVNKAGVQPYLKGQMTVSQAYDTGVQPLKQFMLKQTRRDDLAMLVNASKEKKPAAASDVSMTTLIPAFVLSELRAAFIIGFVIFIPFLVIDLVISSSLMSMGMMMLPPSMISLPFKLLLFVMVDGWALIAHSLIASYR
jgi:flagellar biosynthesis protein FliP